MSSAHSNSADQKPTQLAIAQALNVTPMTVSKALRGVGRISEKTRELIHQKAAEMGYLASRDRLFPSYIRNAASDDSSLRILCPTIREMDRGESNFYRDEMLDGLMDFISNLGGSVEMTMQDNLEDLLEYVQRAKAHAVVLSEPYPTQWVDAIREVAPVIYAIGFDFQMGVDAVFFNEARAASLAVTKLREAGHENIGWLGIHDHHAPFHVPRDSFSFESGADWLSPSAHGTRYAAWLYFAEQFKGFPKFRVCLADRDWRVESLEDCVIKGCRSLFEGKLNPTAIVCASNTIAREAIRQLERIGLSVPNDVSVVSYGVEQHGDENEELTGLVMDMYKVGSLIPEVVQRRRTYPEGLAISIQLDCDWQEGTTVKTLKTS